MRDRAKKKARHPPRPQNPESQCAPISKKAGLQSHAGTPSHASTTNSFLGSVSSSAQRSSLTSRCRSVAVMDENAVSLQLRPAGTNTGDKQMVSTTRRKETLQYVEAMFDREDMLQQEVNAKAARIRELEAAHDTMCHANGNHTTRIAVLEKENGHLQDRKDKFKRENGRLRLEREASQKKIAAYDGNLTASIAERDDLAKQKADLESRLAAAEHNAEEEQRLKNGAKSEQHKLRAKMDELEQRNWISEDRAQLCEQEKATLVQSLRALQEQALDMEAELWTLRTAEDSLNHSNRNLTTKSGDLHEQNCKLTKEIEALRADLSTHSSRGDALADKVQFLRRANTALQGRLDAALDDKDNYAQQLSDQESAIVHLAAHNDELLARKHATDDELKGLRLLRDQNDKRAANMQKKLEDQQARIDDFNTVIATLRELRQWKRTAETEAATQVAELEALRQSTAAQAAHIVKLESEHHKSRQQIAEAARCVTRSAKKEYDMLAKLSVLERSRHELCEIIYARLERSTAYDEDSTYVLAHTWEFFKMNAAARGAEIVDLRARNEDSAKTLWARDEDVRVLKAELSTLGTELASVEDELAPTKRDLASTKLFLEICKAQKDEVCSDFDACKQQLVLAKQEIQSVRRENSRSRDKLAQARSEHQIAERAFKALLLDLQTSLETAHTAELAVKPKMDKLKESGTLPSRVEITQATRGEKRYASQKYVQEDIFGAEDPTGGKKSITAQGEHYWKSIERFYQEVPDDRIRISINGRVLPRRVERLGKGVVAAMTAEPTTDGALPSTADLMNIEKLINKPWTLTSIDTNGLKLVKPSADDLVGDLPQPTVGESAGANNFAQPQMSSEHGPLLSSSSLIQDPAALTISCEEAEEDSLFVPEGPMVLADNGVESEESPDNANSPASVQHKEQETQQARSDSVLSKQMQFVPRPAIMSTPESALAPSKETSRKSYFSQHGLDRIRTDGALTKTQSLPTPLPTPGDQRPAKSVRWAEQLASPVGPVHEPSIGNPSLKRHAPDSDVLARAPKQPRLMPSKEQQDDGGRTANLPTSAQLSSPLTRRRPVRCLRDPKCKQNSCHYAHQTPAASVWVDIDVTRVCKRERDCKDAKCTLSHASRFKCMRHVRKKRRHSEPNVH